MDTPVLTEKLWLIKDAVLRTNQEGWTIGKHDEMERPGNPCY